MDPACLGRTCYFSWRFHCLARYLFVENYSKTFALSPPKVGFVKINVTFDSNLIKWSARGYLTNRQKIVTSQSTTPLTRMTPVLRNRVSWSCSCQLTYSSKRYFHSLSQMTESYYGYFHFTKTYYECLFSKNSGFNKLYEFGKINDLKFC